MQWTSSKVLQIGNFDEFPAKLKYLHLVGHDPELIPSVQHWSESSTPSLK